MAVKYRSKWHRGRFLQYKPTIDFAHVRSRSYRPYALPTIVDQIFFVDHGFTRSVPIQMIRPINNRFVVRVQSMLRMLRITLTAFLLVLIDSYMQNKRILCTCIKQGIDVAASNGVNKRSNNFVI